jgi:hypothetical protein
VEEDPLVAVALNSFFSLALCLQIRCRGNGFFLLFAMVGVAKVLSAAKNKKIPAH